MGKMSDWIYRQCRLAADGEETGPELGVYAISVFSFIF